MKFIINDTNNVLLAESAETAWWTNQIIQLTGPIMTETFGTSLYPDGLSGNGYVGYNSSGGTNSDYLNTWKLTTSGAIYVINQSFSVPSIHLDADNIGLVTLGSETLNTMNDGTYETCKSDYNSPFLDTYGVICLSSNSTKFHWIEINSSGNDGAATPLVLNGAEYNRVHLSQFQFGSDGLKILNSTTKNLITESVFKNNFLNGVSIDSSANQVFQNILTHQNDGHGILSTNTANLLETSNSFLSSRSIKNLTSGIMLIDSYGDKLHDLMISNNALYGIMIDHGSSNFLSKMTIVNNQERGIYSINGDADIILNSTINNNGDTGLFFEDSSFNNFINLPCFT
jgi:hypothetical protein